MFGEGSSQPIPLVAVACPLDAVLEESVDQTLGHGRLLGDIAGVLLRVSGRCLLVVQRLRWLSRRRASSVATVSVASVIGSARSLLARRRLTAVWAAASAVASASKVLLRQLLSQAVRALIEGASGARGLEVSLLPLILGLLVRALEVAAIAIAAHLLLLLLLRAPDLLLASLVGVHGLWERRGRGGKRTPLFLGILLAAIAPAKAKVELQAIALLLVVHVVVRAVPRWPAKASSTCVVRSGRWTMGGVLGEFRGVREGCKVR